MNRARALEAIDPAAATADWTRIDRQLLRRAPVVPLATTAATAVTSSRAGGFQYAPGLGPLIDQMWVR